MATIESQLTLNDGMSGVLKKITANADECVSGFNLLESAASQAFDVKVLNIVNIELLKTDAIIDEITGSLLRMEKQQEDVVQLFRENNVVTKEITANMNRVKSSQDGVNQSMRSGNSAASGLFNSIKQMAGIYLSMQGVQQIFKLSDDMASTRHGFLSLLTIRKLRQLRQRLWIWRIVHGHLSKLPPTLLQSLACKPVTHSIIQMK